VLLSSARLLLLGPSRSPKAHMIYNMKQVKHIVVWASIQYAAHVDGATVHVTGPDERQVEFGDGTTSFATLSGGEGFINSTVNVYAPDFVTSTGGSVIDLWALVLQTQAQVASQQGEIEALKVFVGMLPPSLPPPSSPPAHPLLTGGYGRPWGYNGRMWANRLAFAALASDGSIHAWGYSAEGGTGAPSGTGFTSIFSSMQAFAALASDGSIQAWGYSAVGDNYGGTGAPSGIGFTSIFSTSAAFAALANDGSIHAWVNSDSGGTGAPSGIGFTMFVSHTPHHA